MSFTHVTFQVPGGIKVRSGLVNGANFRHRINHEKPRLAVQDHVITAARASRLALVNGVASALKAKGCVFYDGRRRFPSGVPDSRSPNSSSSSLLFLLEALDLDGVTEDVTSCAVV